MLLQKVFILSLLMAVALSADVMTVQLTAPAVEFHENTPEIAGFNKLQIPGIPVLPAKSTVLALPPGSKLISVNVSYDPSELLRSRKLSISPPRLPVCLNEKVTKQALERYEKNKELLESYSGTTPQQPIYYSKMSHFRNIPFIKISYFPLLYSNDKLTFYPSACVTIHYTREKTDNNIPKWAYENASKFFSNWDDVQGYYTTTRGDSFEYVIITYDSLFTAFDSLVAWKDSIGLPAKLVSYDSIVDQYPGTDNADKIRNFLIDKYIPWGIHYVLIGGNVNRIPMKITYPDSQHDPDYDTPSDYYYAELTDDWDSDADGYCGEYNQDSIGFVPEVIVGRFPYNDKNTLRSISQKTVNFERDTGTWKNRALLLGAFSNFENQYGFLPETDGAVLMEVMKDSMLDGWEYTRMYEEAGIVPSSYPHEQALTHTNVVAEWSTGNYAITNWSGHGNTVGAYRLIWLYDDGDSIPEYGELSSPQFIYISDAPSLDDNHPSIIFCESCSNAGGTSNIARSLIGNGASGTVAATNYGWYMPGWEEPDDGDIMSIDYYFYYYMIRDEKRVGDALFDSKVYYFNYLYFPDPHGPGDPDWTPQMNLLGFILFGDPSLVREGIIPGVEEMPSGETSICAIRFYPNPMNSQACIEYSTPLDGTVKITLFNVVGQKTRTLFNGEKKAGLHTILFNKTNLSNGVYFIKMEAEGTEQKITRRKKIIVF